MCWGAAAAEEGGGGGGSGSGRGSGSSGGFNTQSNSASVETLGRRTPSTAAHGPLTAGRSPPPGTSDEWPSAVGGWAPGINCSFKRPPTGCALFLSASARKHDAGSHTVDPAHRPGGRTPAACCSSGLVGQVGLLFHRVAILSVAIIIAIIMITPTTTTTTTISIPISANVAADS
ncbi:hypothetical protein COCMIDRAFT_24328 [Bipolaris oryzae ATCC 44560]|uniref:Uncharacterized protein n=1 Tax=Bipolaris oryzae ATCC 44560 TaxID=930090 RepID=W6ZJZ8_COCMI|nr:uncharacterized protein COCMIDRAFT_24328 [Bipolaris oryzae ATCC 44560]EUC47769.1 hypothetical protein COCMIDRAFT_24328 [Bipolaris oryzae ATCC 44560]